MLEIYGKAQCPYAWRVRLAAREKGVGFEWLPMDVKDPEPRARANNPEGRSPLAVHEGARLTESMVIVQYIDEAFAGRPLQPAGALERAQMRLAVTELAGLEKSAHGLPADDKGREAVRKALEALEARLAATGGDWLGGEQPSLADIAVIPMLFQSVANGLELPAHLKRVGEYWRRVAAHEPVRQTKP